MIKIINGTCGCKSQKGSIVAKSNLDAPFSLEIAEEKRLVDLGVAVFVDEAPQEVEVHSKKKKGKNEVAPVIQNATNEDNQGGNPENVNQDVDDENSDDDEDEEQTVNDGEAPPTFEVNAGIV